MKIRKTTFEEEYRLEKLKNIINQDEISIAFDILRILKGLTKKRLENVIHYLKEFSENSLVVDFEKSASQEEPKEEEE